MPLKTISRVAPGAPASGDIWIDEANYHSRKTYDGTSWRPESRSATYVIAASNATALEKAQADVVCDGTADEVQINAAIAALPTGGGIIHLTAGLFSINAPILIADRDNIVIEGEGRSKTSNTDTAANYGATTITIANGADCNAFTITHATLSCQNLQFKHFTIHGNKANNASGEGFNINGFLCKFEDVSVEWIKGNAFHYTSPNVARYNAGIDCNDVYVRETDGHGWLLDANCYDEYWDHCYVCGVNGAKDAWVTTSGGGNRWNWCEMDNLDQIGINLVSSSDSRITNCTFSAAITYAALRMASSSRVIIQNNNFALAGATQATVHGLLIGRYGGTVSDNIIANNNFNYADAAIYYEGSTATTFLRNIIQGNTFSNQAVYPIDPIIVAVWTIKDNQGYLAPGEIRTASGSLVPTGTCTATTVTGTFTESPLALKPGANTMTCTASGTINVVMPAGSTAVVTSIGGGATVDGSPKTCPAGATTLITVAAGGTNDFTITIHSNVFAWHNPEAQDIFIKKIVINRTAAGGTATAEINVGIADNGTVDDPGAEFFENLLANNAAAIHDSYVAAGTSYGTQTIWVNCQDSASATGGWVVGKLDTEIANSLAGSYIIEYCGKP